MQAIKWRQPLSLFPGWPPLGSWSETCRARQLYAVKPTAMYSGLGSDFPIGFCPSGIPTNRMLGVSGDVLTPRILLLHQHCHSSIYGSSREIATDSQYLCSWSCEARLYCHPSQWLNRFYRQCLQRQHPCLPSPVAPRSRLRLTLRLHRVLNPKSNRHISRYLEACQKRYHQYRSTLSSRKSMRKMLERRTHG